MATREATDAALMRAHDWHTTKPERPDYRRAWYADRSGIVAMARGAAKWIGSMDRELGYKAADDGVLARPVARILVSLRDLLDGELYGLDGGTLWTMLDELAKAGGWDDLEAAEEDAR